METDSYAVYIAALIDQSQQGYELKSANWKGE